jgi:hypothetical protein
MAMTNSQLASNLRASADQDLALMIEHGGSGLPWAVDIMEAREREGGSPLEAWQAVWEVFMGLNKIQLAIAANSSRHYPWHERKEYATDTRTTVGPSYT